MSETENNVPEDETAAVAAEEAAGARGCSRRGRRNDASRLFDAGGRVLVCRERLARCEHPTSRGSPSEGAPGQSPRREGRQGAEAWAADG